MKSVAALVAEAEVRGEKLGQVVRRREAAELNVSEEYLNRDLASKVQVMREAVEQGLNQRQVSKTGLSGQDAARLNLEQGGLFGPAFARLVARAIAVAEVNARMGKIVAAPTAGSCGVLPAVLFTVAEGVGAADEEVIDALFTAGGIGMIIASRASISGAEGGCQAEVGSAAAMAAAAAVELAGGTPGQAAHAAAMAIKNLLGLVCDPVAGLVEVPCIKRNAAGAVIAAMAAEMSLAGIESKIPVDEVIDAMKRVGGAMPCSLRETAEGGLAATPTGQRLARRWKGDV